MKNVILSLFLFPALSFASAKVIGNGGDSIAMSFKSIGSDLVFQLRVANSKSSLGVDPEKFKQVLDNVKVESTKKNLFIKGKRKDAINYPHENRILVREPSWRMLSIQDKRMLVLHELLGLMGIDDSTYKITIALEKAAAIEVVPYFAGKDEDCLDGFSHRSKDGEIMNVTLTNIVVISDIYSDTDRETYCSISAVSDDGVLRKFSASFTDRCRQMFSEKKRSYRLRVVDDHICDIL